MTIILSIALVLNIAFSIYIFLQCLKLKDALLKVVGPKMDLLSNQLQNLMKR
jgi:hypothetical protein